MCAHIHYTIYCTHTHYTHHTYIHIYTHHTYMHAHTHTHHTHINTHKCSKNFIDYHFVCVMCVSECICNITRGWSPEDNLGESVLLPPCGTQAWNSGHQARWPAPLPTEPSPWLQEQLIIHFQMVGAAGPPSGPDSSSRHAAVSVHGSKLYRVDRRGAGGWVVQSHWLRQGCVYSP